MTDKQYQDSRAEIIIRIMRHDKTLADGRSMYPRCLAAAYRELDKLDEQWKKQSHPTL